MKDKYGTEIEVGDLVAYNYSGEVAIGNVRGFKNVTRYGKQYTYILVDRSIVTSPGNLVVIHIGLLMDN